MTANEFKLTDEIISNARKNMHKLVDDLILLNMDELETYEFPQDRRFGLEVICGEALFYLIIKFSSTNKNFICMNPGAFDRDRYNSNGELIEPPYFSRWSWDKYFEESVIITADPMIFRNDEIKLGWMIGEKDHWYLETLSSIIKKLAKNQKVIHDNILFFGSSGGGFISICLATLIKNSKIIVNNPQLSIPYYNRYLLNNAISAVESTYEGLTKEEIIKEYAYRINLTELIKKENYAPRITYYVNVKSFPDTYCQSLMFIEKHSIQKQFKEVNMIYYSEDKETPHNPLPNEPTIKMIKSFAKNNLYNLKVDCEDEIISEEKYCETLEKNISELENDIKTLKEDNDRINKEKDELKQFKDDYEKDNQKLKNENKKLQNKITEMETSTSWRISEPLRKTMKFLKRK